MAETATNAPVQSQAGDRRISLPFDHYTLLWILVLVVAAFLRFHHLGDKPMHHDESLYAKYIWNYYVGQGYQYDPMQHGPFLFHVCQIALFLFGITETTVRLFPALFGIGLILIPYMARRTLGAWPALITGASLAISPLFTYFQRFLRHDPFYVFWSAALFLCIFEWVATRKRFFAVSAVFSMAMIFCIKENAFITTLSIGSFGILFVIHALWAKRRGRSPDEGGLGIREILERWPFLSKWFGFLSLWGLTLIGWAGYHILKVYPSDKNAARARGGYKIYWSAVLILAALLLLWMLWARRKGRKQAALGLEPRGGLLPAGFFDDAWLFAGAVGLAAAVSTVLYTGFFTHMKGFWDGLFQWFVYWWNQHHIQRIAGPYHYFNHQLWLYDALPVAVTLYYLGVRMFRRLSFIIAMVVWIVIQIVGQGWNFEGITNPMFTTQHLLFAAGVVIGGLWATFDFLNDRKYLLASLTWWFATSYAIYSYLQEKVPWLTMHISLPAHFLAGIFLWQTFRHGVKGPWRQLGIVLLVCLFAFSIHNNFWVNWYNESNPTEQLVYVQTSEDVTLIVEEIKEIAHYIGEKQQDKKMEIVVTGDATWPLYWYLRDWPVMYLSQVPQGKQPPVVICNWTDRQKFQRRIGDDYRLRRYRLRHWWIPNRGTLDKRFSKKVKQIFDYLVYRERWKPELYGSSDICYFVRNDLAPRDWELELDEPLPETPRSELPPPPQGKNRTLQSRQRIGSHGRGTGKLNEPKDLAVDAQGNIYVVDSKNTRIQKFSPEGEHLMTIGEEGEGPGQFNSTAGGPCGIALDRAGNIYVADTWNHRVQKFTPDGRFVESWGRQGAYFAPKDVVVDQEGYLYIVDTGFQRIHKLSPTGVEVKSFGGKGSGPDEFLEPVGIDLGPDGNLYIADTANHRIQVFDREGRPVRQIQVYGWEEFYTEPYIAVAKDGRVLVTDSRNHRLQLYDRTGNFVEFWGGIKGSRPGLLDRPVGVVIANGQVYVSDSYNHRVQRFDLPAP